MSGPTTYRDACCMNGDLPTSQASEATMQVRDLTLDFATAPHFGKGRLLRALDSVSLDIAAGEIVGLVGESGSGKTTLGKTILGAFKPTRPATMHRAAGGASRPARSSGRPSPLRTKATRPPVWFRPRPPRSSREPCNSERN
jgi:ABC-type glutathione transport system ATPase component